ncbi:hypothetical protein AFCA_011739 [Aspergillus flavus]|uniref:Uncharacterized protein n=1 Tax=Aspergillus flavus TaxID=5059 RepID=A0AB74C6Q2_ASPFL|nr:hypothetical protein COH20_011034 [Aspergillus flavus]RAQ67608.1 hypothetical protein COH21_011598 [Aspergillus flavus]RMZ41786.1 hypothetical protein CA14_011254 [Aspergillus flavus]UDD64502.1 hypothetical protein AFCA_011739 [Aspergillus flavus]
MSPVQVPKPNTDAMGRDSPVPKGLNKDVGLVYKRAVQVMVTVIVIFFAPLSFTYFFDKTHTSNLSDKALAVLISPEFAYGAGSGTMSDVNGSQMIVYLRNLTAMFPHTIAGSIAITVGLVQFNTTLQFKYPVIHRWLGRLYALCAVIISWSSMSYIADAMPTKEVFSGDPFAYILSSLSISVPTTMACAIYAIWNGDIGTHREFMVLNYAFMLSAPIPRRPIPSRSIHILPPSTTCPPLKPAPDQPNARLTAAASGFLGLLFLLTKGPSITGGSHPKAFWLALVPQLTFYMTLFTAFARAAKRRGDMRSYTAWATYQNGLISAPLWSVFVVYMARDRMGCSEESLGMITVFGGVTQGLFISFMVYVFATSNLVNRALRSVKSR